MGGSQSSASVGIGAKSTAKEVIETFGTGKYLSGKVAIVTGGNSGIGLETCKALAHAGARVILCSRSVDAGKKAIQDEIVKAGLGGYVVDGNNVIVKQLDLNSLKSIKTFADEFLKTESRLDFLVLNAGIMALPKAEYTDAGFERQIGVNHFGHAYLTQLLLEKMLNDKTSSGRIVALASTAHTMGKVVCEDLHYKKGREYRGWDSYGQSKMANILFAKGLADELTGTHVTAVSVHPGVIQTNLWRQSFFNRLVGNFVQDKTVPQGAATTVYGCVCPRLGAEGLRGVYLSDCSEAMPSEMAHDAKKELRQKLWKTTNEQLEEAVVKAGLK